MSTVASALATALFTLFVPAIVAVGVPQTWIREAGVVVAPGIASRILGSALVALGTIGYFWCATLFVKAQGTPAPVFPTQKTVVGGLYRVNRNPMYTSVLAVVFCECIACRTEKKEECVWALLRRSVQPQHHRPEADAAPEIRVHLPNNSGEYDQHLFTDSVTART